ncbi:MAG: VWA domain-containing protein [Caldilineaceae bacterium]|nr:VWA domain-containing protein [Caldilineaceae bacterium]MBP8107806.1 VWA domain-containing protein [Caldilineaceae bacterium]MBP8121631.1 VWA domain-containing protein [Caldilineaceae bacterium]MBP9073123.1 VWA domain-containing protein [Caldilineaceae bacterium]
MGLLFLCLLLLLLPTPAQAQATQPPATSSDLPIDVVVLLDDSGSMATCFPWPEAGLPFNPPCAFPSPNPPSDPEELRYSAARLLVQLADDTDRVAVLRFDSQVEGVGNLGTLQQVGDATNRNRLVSTLIAPTNYNFRGYTRMDLALEQATALLASVKEPGRSQYILLLTDGEPSQPSGAGLQRPRVEATVQTLRADDVLAFPVVLCNPNAGCAGEFLRARFDQELVREAKTAGDLLQVFSQIFAEIKRDRSVITAPTGDGTIQFTTRPSQAAQQITLITPRGGLAGIDLDGAPVVTAGLLDDPNIELNTVSVSPLPSGAWTVRTTDPSGFTVIQADSYPELLFPPASVADSSASVRYFPAGKPPLIVARGVGPAAGEPLSFNGSVDLAPIGDGNVQAIQLSSEPDEVVLQLGNDTAPLQLVRRYRVEARSDLPAAQVFSPLPSDPGLLDTGKIRLQVGFSAGATVGGLRASVYVTDETDDDQGRGLPVYQANLTCAGALCTDENWEPADGRTYRMVYTVSAQTDTKTGPIRYGDYAETDLVMAPAVYLRGLPATVDLAQIPTEGLPITVMAGTTEEIGRVSGRLVLRRDDTGEVLPTVGTGFTTDVPESGGVEALFRVDGLTNLRPGAYSGELVLEVTDPNGLPMSVSVRPGKILPVTLSVPRPTALLDATTADFGQIAFSSSPSIQLADPALLGVKFEGDPFPITAQMTDSTCTDVTAAGGDAVPAGDGLTLPIRLQRLTPLQPGECSGLISLSGPTEDYDVRPAQIAYRVRVADPEWAVITGDVDFRNLGRAGERATGVLTMRYAGKTPFMVTLADVSATSEIGGDTGPVQLGAEAIEMPLVEVNGPPNADGLYEVPITLVARKAIPKDAWQGSYYAGRLGLSIQGLSGEVRPVSVSFRSPTFLQRYITPWLVPIYSLPWGIITWPLTLLLLLVLVARIRGGGVDEDEPVPVATLHMPTAQDLPAAPAIEVSPAALATESAGGSKWGGGDWGNVWDSAPVGPAASPEPVNGNGNGSPWASGW